MRPSLIAEAFLPDMRFITPVGEVGWVVTEPLAQTVSILDGQLRLAARVSVRVGEQRFRASADELRVAVATSHELVVVDRQGQPLWRLPWFRLRKQEHGLEVDVSGVPECHLDVHGVLWILLPPADELAMPGQERLF